MTPSVRLTSLALALVLAQESWDVSVHIHYVNEEKGYLCGMYVWCLGCCCVFSSARALSLSLSRA